MKRKIKKIIVVLAVCAVSAFAMVATGCGAIDKAKDFVDQMLCEHKYDDGEVTKEATCSEVGELTKTCSECGKTKTEAIKTVDHTPVQVEAVEATCQKEGASAYVKCGICDVVITAPTVIPVVGHQVVTDKAVSPTCLTVGYTEGKHCLLCGEVLEKQEVIAATGHDIEIVEAKEATCGEAGNTEGAVCKTCDKILVGVEEVPALGHTGELGETCTICGDVVTLVGYSTRAIVEEEKVSAGQWIRIYNPRRVGESEYSACLTLLSSNLNGYITFSFSPEGELILAVRNRDEVEPSILLYECPFNYYYGPKETINGEEVVSYVDICIEFIEFSATNSVNETATFKVDGDFYFKLGDLTGTSSDLDLYYVLVFGETEAVSYSLRETFENGEEALIAESQGAESEEGWTENF